MLDTIFNWARRRAPNPSPSLPDIRMIVGSLRDARREFLPEGYLASAAWDILAELALAPSNIAGLMEREIADGLGLTLAVLRKYISRLVEDGFVTVKGDGTESHNLRLSLTSRGQSMVDSIFANAARNSQEFV